MGNNTIRYARELRTYRWPAVLAVFPLVLAAAIPVGAANIFDDNWQPPRRSAPPPPAPVPSSRPVGAANPAPAVAPPVHTISPPAAPAARLPRPVPSATEQAKTRGYLKEVFAEQLKDKSVAARRKLAQALLQEAAKLVGAPIDEFVLLAGAIEAATEAKTLPLCIQAVEQMARGFDVDAYAVKSDAALKVFAKPDPAAATADNTAAGLDLLDQSIAVEDYGTATRLSLLLQPFVGADPALNRTLGQRRRELAATKAARDRVAPMLEKLKTSPDDPAANLAAGTFYCFSKDQWDVGLPMLAKGTDPQLKAVAAAELARPTAAEALARLGDDWWDVAAKQPEGSRERVSRHAAGFYARALDGVVGLRRTVLQRRIAEAAASSSAGAVAARSDVLGPINVAGRDPAVTQAIQKAVEWLYTRQHPTMFWEEVGKNASEPNYGGNTALATYALILAGEEPAKNPKLQQSVDFLTRAPLHGVYPVSLRVQALAALPDAAKHGRLIQQDFALLAKGASINGMFTYELNKAPRTGDLSCTQFGWIGLATAQKQGQRVPNESWATIARTLIRTQEPSGGWRYTPEAPRSAAESMNMTLAGLTIIQLAKPRLTALADQRQADKAIAAAYTFIDRPGQPAVKGGYGLLCCQRVGLLGNKRELSGKDWYKDNAEQALKTQQKDGSWGTLAETGMTLVFLSRGSLP